MFFGSMGLPMPIFFMLFFLFSDSRAETFLKITPSQNILETPSKPSKNLLSKKSKNLIVNIFDKEESNSKSPIFFAVKFASGINFSKLAKYIESTPFLTSIDLSNLAIYADKAWNFNFQTKKFRFGTWFYKTIQEDRKFDIQTGFLSVTSESLIKVGDFEDGIPIGFPYSAIFVKFYPNFADHNSYIFLITAAIFQSNSFRVSVGYTFTH